MNIFEYWDIGGNHHVHNPNIFTFDYSCSRNHRFSALNTYKCPFCDFDPAEGERILNGFGIIGDNILQEDLCVREGSLDG